MTQDIKGLKEENRILHHGRSSQISQVSASLEKIQETVNELHVEYTYGRPTASDNEINSLTRHLSNLSVETKRLQEETAIIRSLDYDQRPNRHGAIPEAHKKTFRWVFKGQCPQGRADSGFTDWLEQGNDLFWITGKPGSGKSTLLKYIANHKMTSRCLSKWSAPKPVVIATHYFWSSGTKLQRSQEGLLRSLIREIFIQSPEALAAVCGQNSVSFQYTDNKQWSLEELQSCLKTIISQPDPPFAICLFVDGVDECSGDHLEICEMLLNICRSPFIKLCASSRPWNVFQDYFGKDESSRLSVHELTRLDISAYAESRLHEHLRWDKLVEQTNEATSLIDEITERAQGVFLWVFLVTKLLREGLTDGDSLGDLRARLNSFPADLELFFKQMLESVGPFYHKKMAAALRMAMEATSPLHPIIFALQEQEYDDENYAIHQSLTPRPPSWFESQIDAVHRRLNGRCKGLLEIHESRVHFLHRTVKDFLETREIMEFLESKTHPSFQPELSIFRAYISWIKQTRFEDNVDRHHAVAFSRDSFTTLLNKALWYVPTRSTDYVQAELLLDELETSVERLFERGQVRFADGAQVDPIAFFREHIVRLWFPPYLSNRLANDPEYFDGFRQSPLYLFFWLQPIGRDRSCSGWSQNRFDTMLCILRNSPQSWGSFSLTSTRAVYTDWSIFIRPVLSRTESGGCDKLRAALSSGALQALLDYGACPDLFPNQDHTHPVWLQFLFAGLSCSDDLLQEEEAFIEALRTMLKHARTLDYMDERISGETVPWNQFVVLMSRKLSGRSGRLRPRLQFQSRIIQELAIHAKAKQVNLPWHDVYPQLGQKFVSAMLEPIVHAIDGPQDPSGNIKKRKFEPVSHSAADTGNPTFEDEDCTMLSGAEDTRQVKKVKRLASSDAKVRPSRPDLQYWNEDLDRGDASDSDLGLLQDDVDSEEDGVGGGQRRVPL